MDIILKNKNGSDQSENLQNQIVLIDPWIHNKTKLSRADFLQQVKYVKYLRTRINSNYISFYITSLFEYDNLLKFHNLINNGIFDFEERYVFAIAVQPKLYNWFKTTSINVIQKQIVSWLAANYFCRPEKRNFIENQLYKPLFNEIIKHIETYYSEIEFKKEKITNENFINKYLNVCKEFYNSEPPEFLSSPFECKFLKEWGTNDELSFDFIEGYFNNNDWSRIIEKNHEDDLHRVESLDDLWLRWKHIFSTFDERNNFVYSFYFETTIKKKKREHITQNIKNEVWKRDEGKCVQCGSNENLEYDHIIPFVKGGSSTIRNLQLLCMICNRKKHDKI